MLLMWKVFRRLSCLAYVVHGSLPHGSVLMTRVVHCSFGLHCQLGVGPHVCCEARKGCGCLPDSVVDLHVQRGVISDGGAEVRELMDRIELIIIDGDGWWCLGTLSQDVIGLFQADGHPEVSAGLGEVVHQCLQFALGVGRYCRIISKQHVSDEGFMRFGHGSEAGEIEKPVI